LIRKRFHSPLLRKSQWRP